MLRGRFNDGQSRTDVLFVYCLMCLRGLYALCVKNPSKHAEWLEEFLLLFFVEQVGGGQHRIFEEF